MKKKTKLSPAQRAELRLVDELMTAATIDPAAVYGIAASLDAYAHSDANRGNVSEAYNGADQFMREIMATGVAFETWANAHVDFDQFGDVWPYMLQEKFATALAKAWGKNSILALVQLRADSATTFPQIARDLKLKLKA